MSCFTFYDYKFFIDILYSFIKIDFTCTLYAESTKYVNATNKQNMETCFS